MQTDEKVTYRENVTIIHPEKEETHRIRLTAIVYQLYYESPTSTPKSRLTTSKLISNIVTSMNNEKVSGLDVDFKPWKTFA